MPGLQAVIEFFRRHLTFVDVVVGVALSVVSIVNIWTAPPSNGALPWRSGDALAVLLVVGANLPIGWRRKDPMTVFWVIAACATAYELIGYPAGFGLGALIAVYTVAAHCGRRESRLALAVTAVIVALILITTRDDVTLANWIVNYLQFVAAWLLGDNLQVRRKYVAELEERAERAEHQAELEAQQAVEAERARIARELHDVVAHSMSVMIVQTGAARRVLDNDPALAAEALGRVEHTGREAMTEMRRLLGVLRQEETLGGERLPQPTLRGLPRLIELFGEANLPVTLVVDGDQRELPPGVELSAFRIVQEALTNVLKHAGPANAEVRVQYAADAVDLEIVDDGRGAAAPAPDLDGGHGLMGMRERVELFNGTLHAGPRPGGGFVVRAHLPLDERSAQPAPAPAPLPPPPAQPVDASGPQPF
jgi:signal transduction histidine kinase